MAKVISGHEVKAGTNLLLEEPEMPIESVVHIARELPKTEEIIFLNNRDAGTNLPLEFHFHSKTHPLKRYKLYNGQRYTLPVEVIRHLEGQSESDPYSCHKREYGERQGPYGTELYVTNYISYYQCRPVR